MSRSSPRLELHASDYLVSYPFDSVPAPSEPPDIGNWFPSYIYESPVLNTLDGLQDLDGSGEACLQEGKKRKAGENQAAAARKSPEKIIKVNGSDEFEYSKCAAQDTRSSESLSFSSEPPDVKNWFSSYLYESSPLDTASDFTISDYKVREDGKVCNAQKSCKQENKDVGFIDVEESVELPQIKTSNVVVKCTNLVKDTKLDYQPVDKNVQNVALTRMPPIPSQLTSEKVSKQVYTGHRKGNNDLHFVEKLGDINTYGKDYDMKLDYNLSERTIPKLSNENNKDFYSLDGEYFHKLVGRKDRIEYSLEKEDPHEIASPETLDLTSQSKPADSRSMGKENRETEILGNGFVSVRNNSKEKAGNLTRPVKVQFESLGNGVKLALKCQKHANKNLKVLSDASNFLSPAKTETSGKWCCPQKNKPNLGPPLKQLRLEKWVRRV